jgi:NAD(P)-dependent dehydrogenase (short-subunit alcohol dehydrogenase family)
LREDAHGVPRERAPGFADVDLRVVRRHLDTHLLGAYHAGQPAWRQMADQGYGRIVLTASAAVFGMPVAQGYEVAKAGVVALTRSLHLEATRSGLDIKVNAVAPFAATSSEHDANADRFGTLHDAANVAAAVVYLASDQCAVSGECLRAGGSYVGRIVLGLTGGWAAGRAIAPEDVADHLDDVLSMDMLVWPVRADLAADHLYERVRQALAASGADDVSASERAR